MKDNKVFSFCNFYILLWLIYILQFFVFGRLGTIYSQVLILILTIVSLYYTAHALFHYKVPTYMKGLGIFVVMLTIYGLFLMISSRSLVKGFGTVSSYTYLLNIFKSLLPVFPFYVFTRRGEFSKTTLQWWTVVFFIAAMLQYYYNSQQKLLEAAQIGSSREEFTNNFGYEFLSIIPLLAFFSKRRVLQYVGLGFLMTFILMSMKRGAILCGAICVVWFLWVLLKGARTRQKVGILVLSVGIIVFGFLMIQNLLETSDYFNHRLETTLEGQSSGRDVLYSSALNYYFNETNFLILIFGNGANATLSVLDQYAHSDWMELLINQGALGIIVYLAYWICFYKSTRKARFDDELYLAVSILLIYNFLRSFFSMSYGDMSIYATVCLGYCMGMISEHENQLKYVSDKQSQI